MVRPTVAVVLERLERSGDLGERHLAADDGVTVTARDEVQHAGVDRVAERA